MNYAVIDLGSNSIRLSIRPPIGLTVNSQDMFVEQTRSKATAASFNSQQNTEKATLFTPFSRFSGYNCISEIIRRIQL